MFNSLRSKVAIPVIGISALSVIVVVLYVVFVMTNIVGTLTNYRIDTASQTALAYLGRLEEQNQIIASSISKNYTVTVLVNEWNSGESREQSRQALLQYLNSIKDEVGVNAFIVTDNNGDIILRTQDVNSYGDPGLAYPPIAAAINHGQVSTAYSYTSSMSMAIYSVSPILFNNDIIGAISVLLDMSTNSFVDNLSSVFNADVAVLQGPVVVSTTLLDNVGNRIIGRKTSPEVVNVVLNNGQELRTTITLNDIPHHSYYVPLRGWDGRPAGVLYVGFSNEYVYNTIALSQIYLIIVGAASLLVITILILFLISRILKPLEILKQNAMQVADGDIAVNLMSNRKDEIGQISVAFAKILDTLVALRNNFRNAESAIKRGNILYRFEKNQMKGVYDEIMTETNDIIYEFIKLFGLLSEPIIIIDKDFKIQYANKPIKNITGKEDCIGMHLDSFVGGELSKLPQAVTAFKERKPQLEIEVQLQLNSDRPYDLELNFIPFEAGHFVKELAGAVLILTNITHIRDIQRYDEKINNYRQERTSKLMDTIVTAFEDGNLSISAPVSEYDDDTHHVALEQDKMDAVVLNATSIIKNYVDDISSVLNEFANNNFIIDTNREYAGEFGNISKSLKLITESVSMLVGEIKNASVEVESGADNISQSTQVFMENFKEQTSTISEVTDAASKLLENAQKNAEDAKSANDLSNKVQGIAEKGTLYMKEMSTAMEDIIQSSKEIANIVGIIESIAFQTNLLALNASVEAARAGEHGRGFAVVAEEVRNLATRSAKAAQDTSEMLSKSLSRVDFGAAKTVQTAGALRSIVEAAAAVTEAVNNIVAASEEQENEVSIIRDNIEEIYQSVQADIDAVQENATISEELSNQAHLLKDLVDQFKISKR